MIIPRSSNLDNLKVKFGFNNLGATLKEVNDRVEMFGNEIDENIESFDLIFIITKMFFKSFDLLA